MRLAATLVLLGLLATVGCSPSEEDVREDYCAQVEKDSDELTRISDEAGARGFLEALPTLEDLADLSPDDLADEWKTYLDALHGWRDALDATGLSAEDVADGMPKNLAKADRQRIRGAASVLNSAEVRAAAQGIEQHALDVCGQPLL